ncbi:hypothetical protein [Anaerosporobacter sp.]
MAEYMLSSSGISQVFSTEKTYADNLADLAESLQNIKNGLRINDYSCRVKIEQQLQKIIENLALQGGQMSSLGTTLEQILKQYTKTEQTIADHVTKKSIETSQGGNTTPHEKGVEEEGIDWSKELTGLAKKILPADFAPYITLLASGFTGSEVDSKIVSEFIKSAASKYKFLGNLADNGAKTAFMDLFGLGKYFKDGAPATTSGKFLQALSKEASSYKPDVGTAASAGKTIAKWGGVVASVVGNGISNYNEYSSGEISSGRAVAETVVETGVDIVKGIALTAAAATVVTAAVGSAPVLAVTAVAVGAGWVADKVCEAFTGKGVTEFVSDGIIDGAEKAIDVVSDVGSNICGAISSFGSGFANWAFG